MEILDMQMEPIKAILFQVGAFLPRLLMAMAVVIAGWLLAKVTRIAVTRALRAVNFNVLTERSGLDGFLRQGGMACDTTTLFGTLAYWLTILAALLIAFNGLGLTYITELLLRVVWFVPNVLVALLVLAFGAYFARFVGHTIASYGHNNKLQDADSLGKIAQYAVMVFVIIIALEQIQVGGDIIRQSFLVILAGIVFALALAFGLGGRDWAANQLAHWWPHDKSEKGEVNEKLMR